MSIGLKRHGKYDSTIHAIAYRHGFGARIRASDGHADDEIEKAEFPIRLMATRLRRNSSDVPVVMQSAAAAQDRSIQQHSNKPQQLAKQTMQEREKRAKRRGGRKVEKKERREERTRRGEGKGAEKERDKEIKNDNTGWTVVTRNKKQRKRTVQIFVKQDKTVREVSPENKVQDVLQTVGGSDQNVYVTCEGKMLRTFYQLNSC